jgi:hypothetical protein
MQPFRNIILKQFNLCSTQKSLFYSCDCNNPRLNSWRSTLRTRAFLSGLLPLKVLCPFQYCFICSSVSLSALNQLEPKRTSKCSQLLQLRKCAVARIYYPRIDFCDRKSPQGIALHSACGTAKPLNPECTDSVEVLHRVREPLISLLINHSPCDSPWNLLAFLYYRSEDLIRRMNN